MRKKKFEIPVTTLIGGRCSNVKKIVGSRQVDKAYRTKYFLTRFSARILGALSFREEKVLARKVQQLGEPESPVFVIGFWRSGTTLMHHLLTLDPQAGFLNTYQSVFPNHVLTNQWWLKAVANLLLPKTRPGDNMKLDFSYPQEEEIALGNLQPVSFYNFFYFPRDITYFEKQSLFFEGVTSRELEAWKKAYRSLMATALLNTGGNRFVSKNPPNTFRIPLLLEMFPDARFIYMHRNTYKTLHSFFGFVHGVLQGVSLQDYDRPTLEKQLVHLYKKMHEVYERDKKLIPAGRLVDVKYEEFTKDKAGEIARIYRELELPGLDQTLPEVEAYLKTISGYRGQKHELDAGFVQLIDRELGDLVED